MAGGLLLSISGVAQVPSPAAEPPAAATDDLRRLPADSYQVDPALGIRSRSIFRDTGAPYTNVLRPIQADPGVHLGSVEAHSRVNLPSFRGRFPLLDRGFEPQDADLKVGPLFFKLRVLTAGFLYSDNIFHDNERRESGTIGIVRLGGTALLQISEGLHFAVSGNLVWLPFENKVGIAGFGLFAPYLFGLEGNPAVHSQVAWETQIGAWNVIIADDFVIDAGRVAYGEHDTFDAFEGGGFDEVDRAGRYSFRARAARSHGSRYDRNDTDADIVYYSNKISATAERLLPGPIRLRVRAYHEDLWYNQGNRGLPRLRDVVSLYAVSERENMRFKPFFSYRAVHTDRRDGFNHEVRLGINGPITDQLDLHADVGWFHRDETGDNRFLYALRLRHIAGPYTVETLSFDRRYNDLSDEIRDELGYRVEQVLGPKIRGVAFASYSKVDDLGDDRFDRNEWRTGVRLTLEPGPRTTFRLSGIYTERDSNGEFGNRQTWTGRLELTYRFTDTLVSRLLYQYQTRDSNRRTDSYDENLVFLTISKYFD